MSVCLVVVFNVYSTIKLCMFLWPAAIKVITSIVLFTYGLECEIQMDCIYPFALCKALKLGMRVMKS